MLAVLLLLQSFNQYKRKTRHVFIYFPRKKSSRRVSCVHDLFRAHKLVTTANLDLSNMQIWVQIWTYLNCRFGSIQPENMDSMIYIQNANFDASLDLFKLPLKKSRTHVRHRLFAHEHMHHPRTALHCKLKKHFPLKKKCTRTLFQTHHSLQLFLKNLCYLRKELWCKYRTYFPAKKRT